MIADCGLLRCAMQVRSKYLTLLREETTSARQQERLTGPIVAVGHGRDFFLQGTFSNILFLYVKWLERNRRHTASQKAQTFGLCRRISGSDSAAKAERTWTGAAPVSPLRVPPLPPHPAPPPPILSPHCPNSRGPAWPSLERRGREWRRQRGWNVLKAETFLIVHSHRGLM